MMFEEKSKGKLAHNPELMTKLLELKSSCSRE
jgi:hypothetical protein